MRRRVAAAGAIPSRERCATRLRAGLAGVVSEWRTARGSESTQLMAPVWSCRTMAAVWSVRLLVPEKDDGGLWSGVWEQWIGWTVIE